MVRAEPPPLRGGESPTTEPDGALMRRNRDRALFSCPASGALSRWSSRTADTASTSPSQLCCAIPPLAVAEGTLDPVWNGHNASTRRFERAEAARRAEAGGPGVS